MGGLSRVNRRTFRIADNPQTWFGWFRVLNGLTIKYAHFAASRNRSSIFLSKSLATSSAALFP
jgi:hypothetical protein